MKLLRRNPSEYLRHHRVTRTVQSKPFVSPVLVMSLLPLLTRRVSSYRCVRNFASPPNFDDIFRQMMAQGHLSAHMPPGHIAAGSGTNGNFLESDRNDRVQRKRVAGDITERPKALTPRQYCNRAQ